MNVAPTAGRRPNCLAPFTKMRPLLTWALLALAVHAGCAWAGQVRTGNPDFLIRNWMEGDGLPESSAYAIAQTPDGYLWVGTGDGVYRYNGSEFTAPGGSSTNAVLNGIIQYLYVDHSGRLWASSEAGLGVRSNDVWRTIRTTNLVARSIAEDASGQVLMGTYDGRVFTVTEDKIQPFPAPDGLAPSGVFCLADTRDGGLWLANRGFVGRLTFHGWVRCGSPGLVHNSLVAATARDGGIWTYTPGKLSRFSADGKETDYPAPDIDQPRALLEDSAGKLWVASNSRGYLQFAPGGGILASATAANGLVHNSSWSIIQDAEGNFWLGSSCGGLSQLRPRVFKTIGVPEGLPNQIVSTVTEESPGNMLLGTHGGGMARLQNGKVLPLPASTSPHGDYVWSVLHDSRGRTWIGTYENGLFVQENGVEQRFVLPPALGQTVNCLFESSTGQIWVGTGLGFGIIENGAARDASAGTPVAGDSVRCIAEDVRSGTVWLGTYDRGIYQLKNQKFTHYGRGNGLPGNRISCLYLENDGCLWAGIFGRGLVSIWDGRITPLGPTQGFPANTVGAVIEDGLGWFWFGTDRGILRISSDQLHRSVQKPWPHPEFTLFDSGDGLNSADCFEGFQPSALRDDAGHLWFATINGVVTVDPSQVRLNTTPPPIVIERISYKDPTGLSHPLTASGGASVSLRPGSGELTVEFAALSYSVPEKNRYAYRLEGFSDRWIALGNRRLVTLPPLPPGTYQLHLKASNNDDIWNEATAFAFTIEPFVWQTLWFRVLVLLAFAGGGGLAAWQLTLNHLRRHIANLERQRALEQDRARLATVMEATSDLVAFADNEGKILHLNPAGRKLLGLDAHAALPALTLTSLHPQWAAQLVAEKGIPTARAQGTWEGETAIRDSQGREIPVTQTIMAHEDQREGGSFLSTIARDISERKRAEQASERLQAQLLQAQKMESVGRLAGGIAHDFNNMLQVILGNSDLALEESTPGSELHSELIEIRKSATRSAELTSQLLTFARKSVFRAQDLNLNEIIGGTSKMLKRLIGENIELVLRCEENLWPVRMDPSQVTQILTNLAINARDAIGGQGRLVIEVANVTLSSHQALADAEVVPGEFVLLAVADTGHGMTREVLDHLFEPFFTTKDIGKGTGLGLATVFGIVKQNQGLIQVESTPGQGTTFRIYFPRSLANSMNSSITPQISKPARGTETIVIVEDEENILHLVVLTLRKQGYQVIPALTPETALNLAAAHNGPVDLLITDIVMPGMNGRDLMEKLSATQPRMKSLFMSGYTADVIAQHGALEAELHFLQKPFTIHSLLEKVRQILDQT
jgi:PAS domain S-box-containing protein